MQLKFTDEALSVEREKAAARASAADELEGALEIAVDILSEHDDSSEPEGEVSAMLARCSEAGKGLANIYKEFDAKSGSEHAEMFDYRAAAGEDETLRKARSTRDDATALIEKLEEASTQEA